MEKSKSLLKFVITLSESIDKALEDNKISLVDLPLLFEPLMAAPAAFEDVKGALEEFKAADSAQLDELVEFVEKDLDLRSDNTEELVENCFELATRLYSIIKTFTK